MDNYSIKNLVSFLILALAMTCATSARILGEEVAITPVAVPEDPTIVASPISTISTPTTTTGMTTGAVTATTPVVAGTTPVAIPATTGAIAGAATTGANAGAATTGATSGVLPTTTGGATGVGAGGAGHALTFFMHDILGGTIPSATAVTGVVNNPAVNGQIPFAKRNGANLPLNNGVSNNNANNAVINNNNVPFLTGLSGTTPNVIQNNNGNNNNNNNFNGGFGFNQLPTGPALEKLMFGTMTVFDDELTEGHELGSGMVGKAQGFYVTSAQDGLSQTMAFTTMFESGGYSDSLSFFGIHRTAVSESHLAIMGGTGKYVNAKGFAIVKTFPATNQHSGDGVETVLEISVYLSY